MFSLSGLFVLATSGHHGVEPSLRTAPASATETPRFTALPFGLTNNDSPQAPQRSDFPELAPDTDAPDLSVWAAPDPSPPRPLAEFRFGSSGQGSPKAHPALKAFAANVLKEEFKTGPTERLVPISAVATSSSDDLLRDLQGIGLREGIATAITVTGQLPASQVLAAEQLKTLDYIRPEWDHTRTGSVDGLGDKALRADIARKKFDVSGKGITVGIISNSFNCLGNASDDITSGDLTAAVNVIHEGDCDRWRVEPHGDEGRAMAQIIADVAPDATLKFTATGGVGSAGLARAVRSLVRSGVDVIVDDVGSVDEPWFQDGLVAQAVDEASAAGVAYFSSAGNGGHEGYESKFRPTAGVLAGELFHDFSDGGEIDLLQPMAIAPGGASIVLQWSDNFKTQVPEGPTPVSDLDVLMLDEFGDKVLLESIESSAKSREPLEFFIVPNDTAEPIITLMAIRLVGGRSPGYLGWRFWAGVSAVPDGTFNSPTLYGHPQARGAIAVGAAAYNKTPAFGVSPAHLQKYSSRGGTPILIDAEGNPTKRAIQRRKPEIVAVDGVKTSVPGFERFPGTSASAPHAAGVAALLLEQQPKAKPTDVCNALSNTAIEMGPKGFDFDSGYGLVNAEKALGWNGNEGRCEKPAIELPYPAAPVQILEEIDPVESEPPSETTAPVISTPVPTPVPSPTPVPGVPLVFANEDVVFAGDKIGVSGWYLPKNARFDVSLAEGPTIGSVQSDGKGRFESEVNIPAATKPGRYLIAVNGGGIRLKTPKSFIVVQRNVYRATGPASADLTGRSSGRGAYIVIGIFLAAFLGFVVFLRRWRWQRI
jgi:subtilisin family serine protease